MKFNKKGQGALEYLLLIGGAVLIAVIVIALLVGMGTSGKQGAQDNATTSSQIVSGTAVAPILSSARCKDGTTLELTYSSTGGDLNIVVDNVKIGGPVPSSPGNFAVGPGICDADGNIVQLRSTYASGSAADSNPIYVKFP